MLAAVLALASCTAGAASPAHHAVPVGTVPPTATVGLAAEGWAFTALSENDKTPTPTIALPAPATPSAAATEAPHVAEQAAEPEPEPSTPIPQTILPAPPTSSGSGTLGYDEIAAVMRSAGWPESLIHDGIAVACGYNNRSGFPNGESGCRPDALNGMYRGLWQLDPYWFGRCGYPLAEWNVPVVNAAVALCVTEFYPGDPFNQWQVKP